MVKMKNISKTYKNGVCALFNIDLHIQKGEFVYITGPTGCGKSTLTKILDAEEIPTDGEVLVGDIAVEKLKHRQVPKYRRKIGVVFQNYRLLEYKTVFENISFALECMGGKKKEIRERVKNVIDLVDLNDKTRSYPRQLSGGQQQRVAIARAIVNKPDLLICDEPTGNLDPEKSKDIIELLEKINKEENTTIVLVTHDQFLVETYRHRTIRLEEGHIVSDIESGGYNYNV
ncbi:MAG: cell division ATP-binding protein FtsE [Erysipelotrichaceae bacterium]